MAKNLLLILSFFLCTSSHAQAIVIDLDNNWQFSKENKNDWHRASVPGCIHTDLLDNKLIPDPFFSNNESKLQWIDKINWDYKSRFNVSEELFSKEKINIIFDGLDTYANVYLNGKLILQADNMFRQWTVNIKPHLKKSNNILLIKFFSAQNKVDSISRSKLPLVLPDNNRLYVRKAQYQFGWDWGPKFVSCGIWKKIRIEGWNGVHIQPTFKATANNIKLIREKDSAGMSFYFEKNGKPVYCKGANWIPANIFPGCVKKQEYLKLLTLAKAANMNMLRVWGGGIYESDDFYNICDSLGIMIWQDFMFAGAMYPGDEHFINNVKEEVKYQIERLKLHSCIVVWCGNNEIDEAWHNWGWQDQFKLHGNDSAKVWNDYKKLFEDSLATWVNDYDGTRPYIPSSPMHGWGHEESFKEGDSHYWGIWWGLEDWESFKNKTGRFVSEYGMQAMPNIKTIESYTNVTERFLFSDAIKSHQKANDGFLKLNHYLNRYFIDSARIKKLSLKDYTYLTQCLQYYILKNSIAIHRSKSPYNMGTLVWQLNDCWPVTSWSIIDHSEQPKAAWYVVGQAYSDSTSMVADTIYPRNLSLSKPSFVISYAGEHSFMIQSDVDAKYIYLYKDNNNFEVSDNYFDLKAGEKKIVSVPRRYFSAKEIRGIKIKSLFDVID